MVYAKIVGNEITYYPSSLWYLVTQKILETESPTDEQLAEANVVAVKQLKVPKPVDEFNYNLKPVCQPDGTWQEEWVQTETSAEAREGNKKWYSHLIVTHRNLLLTQSDWTQMPDAPLTNREAWKTYRQALRDVPLQEGFPFNVQWPRL